MTVEVGKDVCSACENLEKYNYDFVQKGITEDMQESLKKDKGLKESNGHNNCQDLRDMSDCLIGGMIEDIPSYNSCDINQALEDSMVNLMQVIDAIISGDCGQWEQIWKLWDEIKALKQRVTALEQRIDSTNDKFQAITDNLSNALIALLTDLKNSGAWNQSGSSILEGSLNANRHIATGNINLFGGTTDGNSFIRTNNGKTENDLAGGL